MFLTCSSNRSITALRAAASLRMGQISLQDSDTTVCSIYSLADTGLLRLMLLFGGLKVRYNCWSFSEGSHPLIDKQCNMSTGGTPWNHAEGFSPVSPFISCYKSQYWYISKFLWSADTGSSCGSAGIVVRLLTGGIGPPGKESGLNSNQSFWIHIRIITYISTERFHFLEMQSVDFWSIFDIGVTKPSLWLVGGIVIMHSTNWTNTACYLNWTSL